MVSVRSLRNHFLSPEESKILFATFFCTILPFTPFLILAFLLLQQRRKWLIVLFLFVREKKYFPPSVFPKISILIPCVFIAIYIPITLLQIFKEVSPTSPWRKRSHLFYIKMLCFLTPIHGGTLDFINLKTNKQTIEFPRNCNPPLVFEPIGGIRYSFEIYHHVYIGVFVPFEIVSGCFP